MRRILITNRRSPGDVVAMTAAVRDLTRNYPGAFEIHVGGSCPELWQHNPYVAGVCGATRPAGLTLLEPDIRAAMRETDRHRMHYLAAYHREFERLLGISLFPLYPRGDLHLTEQERGSRPIAENYWLMIAGGKRDLPVKIWSAARFRAAAAELTRHGVRIVQVGSDLPGHLHPPIEGTVDYRGTLDLRMFLQLVYHADGVICPVTFAMHVAAAFEKPCVVLAGGREPWWWEAYIAGDHFGSACGPVRVPHKYFHAIGNLDCCRDSGCWRTHVTSLGETTVDRPCLLPVNDGYGQSIPRCLDLINVDAVVEAVLSFQGSITT